MIKVWHYVRKYLKEPIGLSQFSPIWGNQQFIPGRADGTFKLWAKLGLKVIGDLFPSNLNTFWSFGQLQSKFCFDKKHYFKFLQLRSFVKTHHGNLNKPPLTSLEKLMIRNKLGKGIISNLYKMLISNSTENSSNKLKNWNEDLPLTIREQDWERACAKNPHNVYK